MTENYGTVNISLINDLPLYIDPFLLFNSDNPDYQRIHEEMIDYLLFLKKASESVGYLSSGMRKAWYSFSEVKQTWLGFSLSSNSGCGMGNDFASGLYDGLNSVFKDFGSETITKGWHMEKLCLISPRVGRDKISDFTINFAKRCLLEYTQKFARTYLNISQCKECAVPRGYFNKTTNTRTSQVYYLSRFNNDYVLLTPKDMLTGDDAFTKRNDMLRNLQDLAPYVSDDALRFELESYFWMFVLKLKGNIVNRERKYCDKLNS